MAIIFRYSLSFTKTPLGKLSLKVLKNLNETLKTYTTLELTEKFGLKTDHADVITHAADIYIDVANSTDAKNFIVPKKKLIDGIIHSLCLKWENENPKNDTII